MFGFPLCHLGRHAPSRHDSTRHLGDDVVSGTRTLVVDPLGAVGGRTGVDRTSLFKASHEGSRLFGDLGNL